MGKNLAMINSISAFIRRFLDGSVGIFTRCGLCGDVYDTEDGHVCSK